MKKFIMNANEIVCSDMTEGFYKRNYNDDISSGVNKNVINYHYMQMEKPFCIKIPTN